MFRKLFYTTAFLGVMIPVVAVALNVQDYGAYAKFAEQLKQLKAQFDELQEIRDQAASHLKAIGDAGRITIPILNLDKVEGQLLQSIQCSLLNEDDLQRMLPSINFEELDFSSVCNAKQFYRTALFPTSEEYKNATTAGQQAILGSEIRARRTVMVVDTSTKALALADVTTKNSEKYTEAIQELLDQADSVETSNDRLAVIAKGQALIATGINQTNQLLAAMLKQQSAHSIRELPLVEAEIEEEN